METTAFWAIQSFVRHIGNCWVIGAYVAYVLEFAVRVYMGMRQTRSHSTGNRSASALFHAPLMGVGQKIVAYILRKIETG